MQHARNIQNKQLHQRTLSSRLRFAACSSWTFAAALMPLPLAMALGWMADLGSVSSAGGARSM